MTIEDRIEVLERDLDRARRSIRQLLTGLALTIGALALGWGVASVSGAAQTEPTDIVRAHKFLLTDEKDNVRALLGTLETRPVLALFDEKGEVRARLAVTEHGPLLKLADEKGQTRVALFVLETGTTGMLLTDETGFFQVQLAVKDSGPGLALVDEKGHVRAGLSVNEWGPALQFSDEKGQTRAAIGTGETSSPDGATTTYPESSLRLFGPDGGMIWRAP